MQYFILENINDKLKGKLKQSTFGTVITGRYSVSSPMFNWNKTLRLASIHDPKTYKLMSESEDYDLAREYASWLEGNFRTHNKINGDVSLTIPKLPPRNYQKGGIFRLQDFRSHGFRGHLLGDEPGVGKTAQIIFDYTNSDYRSFLGIVPAHLKYNLQEEWEKFSDVAPPFIVQPNTKPEEIFVNNNVIINYDLLNKFHDVLVGKNFDYVACDEAHKYLSKPPGKKPTHRSALTRKITDNSRWVTLMTGTPWKGYVRDIQNLLSMIVDDCSPFLHRWNFTGYFCDRKKIGGYWNDEGSSNQRELRRILYSSYITRRKLAQVIPELPSMTRKYITVDVPASIQKEAMKLMKKWELRDNGVYSIPKEFWNSKPAQELKLKTGLAKVKPTLELIDDSVRSGPLLVFAYHREVINKLIHKLPGCAYVIGGMSAAEKDKQVKRFQNGDTDVCTFSLTAGAEGLTMTRANKEIMAEFTTQPDLHTQAERRIYRSGQGRVSMVVYVEARNTLDDHMKHKLETKNNTLGKVM